MVDPERPGKRHLSWRQSLLVIALIILTLAVAPWLMPLMPYR
tara:strand:+ start:323 stop:448 length:126 start_codon:yes stop_codon:yes gene_type:complete